jgi:hypothetical protein
MMQSEPEFKINWVRVYQNKNDPKQQVGCSTIERPTRNFIEAHEKRYKQDGDVSNPCGAILFCANLLLCTSKLCNSPSKKLLCATMFLSHQVHPLKEIRRGGGTCSPTSPIDAALPESCGGESRGVCLSKSNRQHRCKCLDGWTGPYCLNPTGYDDIIWDPPETWSDLGFHGPSLRGGMGVMVVFLSMMGILLVMRIVMSKKRRQKNWKFD